MVVCALAKVVLPGSNDVSGLEIVAYGVVVGGFVAGGQAASERDQTALLQAVTADERGQIRRAIRSGALPDDHHLDHLVRPFVTRRRRRLRDQMFYLPLLTVTVTAGLLAFAYARQNWAGVVWAVCVVLVGAAASLHSRRTQRRLLDLERQIQERADEPQVDERR